MQLHPLDCQRIIPAISNAGLERNHGVLADACDSAEQVSCLSIVTRAARHWARVVFI